CRKGRMLPHTGLFLLWKVALQMRIRRRLKIDGLFRMGFENGIILETTVDGQPETFQTTLNTLNVV
ncbi:hypothetical protein, partial [Neisseria mucosa]